MLFQTYDPYYNDVIIYSDIIKQTEECFICYQYFIDDTIRPIKLNENFYYSKKCNCQGSIHKKCLDTWLGFNNTCPICRNTITDVSNEINKLNEIVTYKYLSFTRDILRFLFVIYIILEIVQFQTFVKN